MEYKKDGVKMKVYENKVNKQRTLVLPRKIFGDINEVIFDKQKKSLFFK